MSTITGTEAADRQRQRAERGIGTSRKPGGRLPTTSKRRRPAVAALAALLIVGGALIAGVLAVRMDERVAVIQVAATIGVGEKITREDLAETRVAGDSLDAIPVDRADEIIGKRYAKVNLIKGQLLLAGMITDESPIAEGKAEVGIVLVPGRIPAGGVNPGDQVELIRIGTGTQPPVLIGTATVLDLSKQTQTSSLGNSSTAAQTATVLIDRENARLVTDASGNNRIAVALLKSGTSVGEK